MCHYSSIWWREKLGSLFLFLLSFHNLQTQADHDIYTVCTSEKLEAIFDLPDGFFTLFSFAIGSKWNNWVLSQYSLFVSKPWHAIYLAILWSICMLGHLLKKVVSFTFFPISCCFFKKWKAYLSFQNICKTKIASDESDVEMKLSSRWNQISILWSNFVKY